MKTMIVGMIITIAFFSALPAEDSGFGSKDPGLLNLKGAIYFLPADTEAMPDGIEKQEPKGIIYTEKLDIPLRDFQEGFPGVTDRFEWFGILYSGTFEISAPGLHKWRLESDDGSRLWIDGRQVIDNDGIHGMASGEAEVDLGKGRHAIKVWYFQGPATEVGLQLYVTVPGSEAERIFSLADFSSGVSGAMKDVDAHATREGIRIQLDAQVLFDTNRFDLKPEASRAIASIARIIATYPGCRVRVEGHTDSVGSDESNQVLSENRARSVRDALKKSGVAGDVRFEVVGCGESQPKADNASEKGRALNRRVELLVIP